MSNSLQPRNESTNRATNSLAGYLKRIESDGEDREAWKGAVLAMVELGALKDAVRAQRRLAELSPSDPSVWSRLGRLLIVTGSSDRAMECYQEALRLDSAQHDARVRLGLGLMHAADTKAAGACFGYVLQQSPQHMDARAGAAQLLDRLGDSGKAWKLLQRTKGPASVLFAVAVGIVGRHVHQERKALKRIATPLEAARGHDRAILLHSCGDLHESLGEHDLAWACWEEANQARGLSFNTALHDASITSLIERTTPLPASEGVSDPRPVFIVGMPRSGTTLLESMIDSHPHAAGVGELYALRDLAAEVPRIFKGSGSFLDELERIPEVAPQLGAAYLEELDRLAPGAHRVVDKMPNNALLLMMVGMCLPDARILWCERNEDDVAVSCFQKSLGAGLSWATSLEGIRCWQRNLNRLKAHWSEVLPNPIHTVHYEELVNRPEAVLKDVTQFLGLPYDEAMLRFHQRRRQVATASFDQVTEAIHTKKVGRSRHYQRFLSAVPARP